MTRITDLKEVLFPVEERPIFYKHDKLGLTKLDNYKAIINKTNDNQIAVVSKDYQLITNEQALEIGKDCFKQVFNTINTDDMEIFNITFPSTKSFCHIDVVHKNYTLNLVGGDVWLPYIRITNSYNRTKALSFDFGFCRRICNNGVIFEKEAIKYKYYHVIRKIKPAFINNDLKTKLRKMEKYFSDYVNILINYQISNQYCLPMICKVFNYSFSINNENGNKQLKERERFISLVNHVSPLITNYITLLGPNGYAMLSILSDIATRPPKLTTLGFSVAQLKIDNFQKRVSHWIEDFCRQIKRKEFSIESYLDEYINKVEFWERACKDNLFKKQDVLIQ